MVTWGLTSFTVAEPHLHSQEGPGKISESLTLVSGLGMGKRRSMHCGRHTKTGQLCAC